MPHTQKLSSSDIFGFFRYFIKPYRMPIALMFVFFLATVVDRAFMPYLFSRIIDKIEQCTKDRELIFNSLVLDVAVIIAIYCALEVCYRAKGFLEARIIPKFQADIRIEANRRLQGYPLGFFFNNSIGSITAKINNLPHSAAEVCVEMIEVVVPVICTAIVSIIMLCSISLYISGFFVIWFILHLAVTFFFTRKCTSYSNIHAESLSNLSGIITDSMRNIMNIKLFMRADYELSYIKKHQKVEADNNSRVIRHIEKTKIILGILTITEYAGALVIALLGWKNGQLSIGDIVFVFNISSNMLVLAWWLTLECPFIFKHIGVVRQGLTIFDLPEKLQQEKGTKQLFVTKGAISFNHVNFGYSASKKVFDDLSIEITPGTKVGLVGFSGSGKSTFANLLQKFYLPDSGIIAIDGQNIQQINNESLMSNIAVVPQNVTLFQRTIAENIMCANVNADYEDMIKAAKQACCHDFIIKTEHGYDSVLSDVVANLSGGQRQLIGIARAIIKNAPILILDEATSALDYITEMKIRKILDKLMEGKTAIIIAHRLSTLAKVDRILVFQNGKIVEDGTHQSLLARNEHYAMLWNMHSNGFIV